MVWNVNISGDGRLLVAAFGDGIIRWYRVEDGRELLAFFPHRDKKRWILWTPEGNYDASAGAEELLIWHKNNGKEAAADYFSIGKFKESYYRPDEIARIFEHTEDKIDRLPVVVEKNGVKPIDKALPPVVSIISPKDGAEVTSKEVTVRFTIRSPSGEPATGIRILVDGRPVGGTRGISLVPKDKNTEDVREEKVVIPDKDSEITLLAENRDSKSEPVTIRVKWRGEQKKEESFISPPVLYVLAVGVNDYQDTKLPKLGFAAKDAKDFAEAVQKQKGDLYRNVVVRLLTDEKATTENILKGLEWIENETTSKDVAMVFFAGHGYKNPNGVYYFLPVNADMESLKSTGVIFSQIKETVETLSGKTYFFVDTCKSGSVMGGRRGAVDIDALVNELVKAENGAVVFAASSGNQDSLESKDWGNGAFTKALVEGINGKADYTKSGKISINMLDLYISERVKELTKGKQTPTTTKPKTIQDYTIAVRR